MSRMIPSGGDIFIKREQKKHHALTSAPKKRSKTVKKTIGIVASMLVLMVGINAAVVAGQTVLKPQTANTITDETTPPETPGIMQFLSRAQSPAAPEDTSTATHETTPITNPPTYTPPTYTPPTFNFNQPINQPINNPNGDLGSMAGPISQANSQIVATMQQCIQISAQAHAQVTQLRATETQMAQAITQINQQNLQLNPNDPNTPQIRAQLIAQRDQIIAQRTQVINTISQTKSAYYRVKGDCINSVARQQTAKRNLENSLQNAFQRGMNVPLY